MKEKSILGVYLGLKGSKRTTGFQTDLEKASKSTRLCRMHWTCHVHFEGTQGKSHRTLGTYQPRPHPCAQTPAQLEPSWVPEWPLSPLKCLPEKAQSCQESLPLVLARARTHTHPVPGPWSPSLRAFTKMGSQLHRISEAGSSTGLKATDAINKKDKSLSSLWASLGS